ncbi:MAG: leucine-rich repeat protein, partial [Thermoplasmatales archaeon]|nr:leucine-rich repeat protein [Thermoplasmatales archaeon]
SIDKCAFYLCANLVSVIIPDSVNSIGDSAFQVCFSLDNIRFLGDAPAVGSTWTHAGMTIYYYEGTAGFDQSAPGWNDLALRELTILDVTGADVSDISDHIYTSKSIRPGFTVTLEETIDSVLHVITLVNGVDYAVLYSDNINVGTATVTITGIGNYSGSVIGNFEITKKEIMVTPDDGQSKVYGEADPELTYTLSDETARASLSGALGRITDDGAGTYAITLGNLSAGNNYKLILVDADFTITKAPLTVTAEDKSVTFPNPFTAYTVMYSGFVGTDSESDLGGILNFECAYNGSAFAATFTIGPSGLTSANYEITFTAGTLNVNKANVATPKGISNITYDGTPQIGVLGDAGYTLTGRTAINAGNYTATATLNDGYIWSGGSIDPAEISWSIAPMTVTVIPNALSKVYGGGDPVLTYTLSKELNVAVTGTLQRDAGEDVGSYLIKFSKMSAGSNYSLVMVTPAVCFEITERDLSAAAVNAADQIYNGSPMEPDTVVTLGGITLDEGTDYTISYTDNMIAGTATVTVTGAGNYEGEAVGTFLIARKTVTVTPDAGQSKIFGSGDPVLTYTLSETVSMTGALSREGDDNIGTYLIILGTLSAGDNYDLILETADFLINKANQIVSSEGYTGIYDGASHGIAVTHNGTISYSTDGMTYGTDPLTYINAGTYTVYFKVIKANHTDYIGSETVLITKATLSATYGGGTAVFGSSPALTVSVTGFVNGETALTAAGYTAPTVTNANVNAGTYMLTPSGGAAANYVFSCVAGNLIVVPQELTITPAAGQTMTYTGSAPVSLTFAETLPDGVAAAGALTIGTVCDAGTYKILKGTLASGSPNYVFAVDETVDYVISPKDVTVTPDALSKAYNQADPVLTYALSEAIDVTGSLSRDSGDDIGTYVILMDTLEPVSGNYVLAMVVPSVTFEIKGIYIISFDSDEGTDVDDIIEVHGAAVTAPSNPTKTGCTFKEWTLSGSPYTFSTMPAENIELKAVWTVVQYTITFDPGEGTAVDAITGCYESTVTPPADPTRAGHRFGGWSPAVPATMPAEDVTVTAVWKTIVDAPAPVTDLTYDGSAQTGVLSGTGYTLSGYIATSARTHTATATLSSGYIWSDGTDEIKDVYWTISQKEIIVTPVVLSKVYGEADPELTYTLSEPIPVTGSLSRTAGEGAGTYAMTLGSLEPVLGNYILTLAPSDFEIVAEGTEDAGSTEVGITESNAMILLEIGAAVLAVVIAAMVLRRQ